MIARRSDWDARLSEYLASVRRFLNIGPRLALDDGGDCQRVDIVNRGEGLGADICVLSDVQNIRLGKLGGSSVSFMQIGKIYRTFIPTKPFLDVAYLTSRHAKFPCQLTLRSCLVGANLAYDIPVNNCATVSIPMDRAAMDDFVVAVFLGRSPSQIACAIVGWIAVAMRHIVSFRSWPPMEGCANQAMSGDLKTLTIAAKDVEQVPSSLLRAENAPPDEAFEWSPTSTLLNHSRKSPYSAFARGLVVAFPMRNWLPNLRFCHA